MIDSRILAHAPQFLAQGPDIYRRGMLLFRQGQPGIVAHLVEGGGMNAATSAIGAAANPVGVMANVAGHAVTIVQNEQIKAGIAAIQTLQLQNLALTGVGIGISILSHQLLSAKLNTIEGKIDGLDVKLERISRQIEDFKADAIKQDMIDLRSRIKEADDVWSARAPDNEWRRIASDLQIFKARFRQRIAELIANGDLLALAPFIDAFAIAATTQISCRLASGDDDLAIKLADDFGSDMTKLLSPIGTADLLEFDLRAQNLVPGKAEYVTALVAGRATAEERAMQLREQEDMALSMPHTLRHLRERGVNGRDWLEAARAEDNIPLLVMPVREAADIGQLSSGPPVL